MHRRTFIAAGASAMALAVAGCLGGDDDELLTLVSGEEGGAVDDTVELDDGEYELVLTFDSFAGSTDLDEPYVHAAVSTEGHGETVAEVMVEEEGMTAVEPFTIDDGGEYVAVLQVPTLESEARATLQRA